MCAKVYDLRSDVVHGNRVLPHHESVDALAEARRITRDALRKLFGERSDLLSAATAARMVEDIGPGAECAVISNVGHAPVLDEPESVAAIDRLLARVLNG